MVVDKCSSGIAGRFVSLARLLEGSGLPADICADRFLLDLMSLSNSFSDFSSTLDIFSMVDITGESSILSGGESMSMF